MCPRAFRPLVAVVLLVLLPVLALGQELLVSPENGKGVYRPGETIRWNVQVRGGKGDVAYKVKRGGVVDLSQGKVAMADGKGQIESRLDEPGWLLAEVTLRPAGAKEVRALGGALVAPEKIGLAVPRPDDFDRFWEEKLAELSAVPMNAKVDPADGGKPDVDYYQVTMDNLRGSHIRGQLARPKKGDKLPAMLIVQWAGVYPLQKSWATDRAAEGWLVLNINAHDLPIDSPQQFYQAQSAGPLNGYPAIGNDDRETSYFLRMYLSCYRGAQYLAERSDWDGRTLVVTGGSQGGLQSIVTAALHPKITGVMACVPAGCDLNGPEAQRMDGWPKWYWSTAGKDAAKVRKAAGYYDVVNFASRVKCPVLVGLGLIDTTCPAPGVYAACNQLKGPKEVVVLPVAEHGDKNGSHGPYYGRVYAWSQAFLHGQPAPVE